MKKPLIVTMVLVLFMLTSGPAHSEITWLQGTDEANSFVFSVEKTGGDFIDPDASYLQSLMDDDRKASNKSQGENDPYDAIAEVNLFTFDGDLQLYTMAKGPDQDNSGNPVNPANGLKVQACAQTLLNGTLIENRGAIIEQKVTAWSTRWFTVDEELSYNLQTQLGGTVTFDDFFISIHHHATYTITAEVTLEALVVSETGSVLNVEGVHSQTLDFGSPSSLSLLLSPTNSSGQQITYQLKTRITLESEMINFDWQRSAATGSIDGTFNIGTPENPIALTATIAKPVSNHFLTTRVDEGVGSISPEDGEQPENEVVGLTATPDSGYRVAAWNGTDDDGTTATTNTVTMDGDRTVSVSFEEIPTYTLSTTINPSGAGSVTINPHQSSYEENTKVTLKAEAHGNYQFARWEGADVADSTAATTTIDLIENSTLTAIFEEIPAGETYTLSAGVTPDNAGKISINPSQEVYGENTVVTLTAEANAGYHFDRWEGTVTDQNASSTTVVMDQDHAISALFLHVQDDDADGVGDLIEQGPDPENPNPDYDGNDDGIPDHLQSNVVSMPTHDGQYYVTLACAPENDLKEVKCLPPGDDAPSGLEFPFGFFDFKIAAIYPGSSEYIKIILPDGIVPDTYFKVGPTPDDPSDHWYEFSSDGTTGAIINGNTIILSFVDGDRGDDDLAENALIVDQGGPAVRTSSPASITDDPAPATPQAQSESSEHACFISVTDGKTATDFLRTISTFFRHIGGSFTAGAP